MPRIYMAAVMAAVLSACGSEPAAQTSPATADEPMMHDYGTHDEAMAQSDGSGAGDAAAARLEADARRRLEEIPAPPPSPMDSVWHVVVAGEERCETLQEALGVSYPAAAMDLFASEGNPLDILHFDGTSLLAQQLNNPGGDRLVFVMGESRCHVFLAGLTAQ